MTGAKCELFPGFLREELTVNGTTINTVRGGAGAPVLLLHGYPQTHAIWHRVGAASTPRPCTPAARTTRTGKERIRCPLLVLWGAQGIGSSYDVLLIWQRRADAVQGRAFDSGHFLAEERPAETAAELSRFLEQR
jgi:pimeloyl-ACP methyl ester carboxylesterase